MTRVKVLGEELLDIPYNIRGNKVEALKDAMQEIHDLKDKINTSEAYIEVLNEENDDLSAELKACRKKVVELKDKVETFLEFVDSMKDGLEKAGKVLYGTFT